MAFYSMQLMINEAQKYGVKFTPIPDNQKPTPEFNQLMNYYNQAKANLQNNPTQENQTNFNSISGFIKDIAVHDSTFTGTGKIYNYSIGDTRGVFYPNDKYPIEPNRLQLQTN